MKKSSLKLLLCRHGESYENVKGHLAKVINDARLTKKGTKQTRAFIPIFKKYHVEKIYYSPKKRTKGISLVINKTIKIPHESTLDLTERNWGAWGSHPWKKVSEKLDKLSIKRRYTIVPPRGESWKQFEKRLLKALEQIKNEAKKERYQTVAIITHRGCLRAILPVLNKVHIKKHKEFDTKLGSITVLSINKENKYEMEKFNHIPKGERLTKK